MNNTDSTFGLHSGSLHIVDHDPAWPSLFEEERRRLQLAEELAGDSWEHIGSTAVPGLSAKPIIDMLIRVNPDNQQSICLFLEENCGYRPGGFIYDQQDYLLFRDVSPVTHILHIVDHVSNHYQDKIRFRDLLRTSSTDRKAYDALKKKLARMVGNNRRIYGEYKSRFITNRIS